MGPEARQVQGVRHITPPWKIAAVKATLVVWSVPDGGPMRGRAWRDLKRPKNSAL